MHIHSGTNKNIYFKIFSFARIVCSRQRVSTSEDKVGYFTQYGGGGGGLGVNQTGYILFTLGFPNTS